VPDAVKRLARAGVRTVMVTGESATTAAFAARQVGLDGAKTLTTGPDLVGATPKAIAAGPLPRLSRSWRLLR